MIANSAHIPAYKNFPERFEIAAVCDVFEKAAKDTAESAGIEKYYTDAETMLSEIKPDLVSVCAPNMLHKQYTMLCLRYGANVICEKPVAFSLSDAKEM
jgi:predicted dehydrogenase